MRAYRPGRFDTFDSEDEQEVEARRENVERYIRLVEAGQPLFDRPSRARRLQQNVEHRGFE